MAVSSARASATWPMSCRRRAALVAIRSDKDSAPCRSAHPRAVANAASALSNFPRRCSNSPLIRNTSAMHQRSSLRSERAIACSMASSP